MGHKGFGPFRFAFLPGCGVGIQVCIVGAPHFVRQTHRDDARDWSAQACAASTCRPLIKFGCDQRAVETCRFPRALLPNTVIRWTTGKHNLVCSAETMHRPRRNVSEFRHKQAV